MREARDGNAQARLTLASNLLAGDQGFAGLGVERPQAKLWLEEAAAKGRPGALAALSAAGEAPADARLQAWTKLAAENGDAPEARKLLKSNPLTPASPIETVFERGLLIRSAAHDHSEKGRIHWLRELEDWCKHLESRPLLFLGDAQSAELGRKLSEAMVELATLANRSRNASEQATHRNGTTFADDDKAPSLLGRVAALLPRGPSLLELHQEILRSHYFSTYGDPVMPVYSLTGEASTPEASRLVRFDLLRWIPFFPDWNQNALKDRFFENLPANPWTLPGWDDEAAARFLTQDLSKANGFNGPHEVRLARMGIVLSFCTTRLDQLSPASREALVKALAEFAHFHTKSTLLGGHPGWPVLVQALRERSTREPNLRDAYEDLAASYDPNARPLEFFERKLRSSGPRQAMSLLTYNTSVDDYLNAIGLLIKAPADKASDAIWLNELAGKLRQAPLGWKLSPQQEQRAADTIRTLALERCSGPDASKKLLETGLHLQFTAAKIKPAPYFFLTWLAKVPADRLPAVNMDENLRALFFDVRTEAMKDRKLEALMAIAPISQELVADEIDELQGFPKRKAKELLDAYFEKGLALLENPAQRMLAGRVIYHAYKQGVMMHPFSYLNAARALGKPGEGKPGLAETPQRKRAQAILLMEAIQSPQADDEIEALLNDFSEVARQLWESRSQWSRHNEQALFWVVRRYAYWTEKPEWAQKAWKEICADKSPVMRLVMSMHGAGEKELPPPPSQDELKSPAYQEAAEALRKAALEIDDDPSAELAALPQGTS